MSADVSMILDTRRAKKDAVYPVKLRIYYQGKAVLYPTVYNLTQEEYNKLTAKRTSDRLMEIRDKLDDLKQQAENAADAISPFNFEKFFIRFVYEHRLFIQKKKKVEKLASELSSAKLPEDWIKRFPLLIETHPFPNAISVLYAEIIKTLLHQKRVSTAICYHDSYVSFKSFRGNIRISEVTASYLYEYEAWILGQKKSITTVGMYARGLRAIYKKAIKKKLVSQEQYPFGREEYLIPTGKNIKKAIDKNTIAELYNSELEKEHQEKARDYWFFIYYGNGMNIKDLIHLKYRNIIGDYLVFERAKTSRTSRGRAPILISSFITRDMRRVIEKWGNQNKAPDNYLFPILQEGMSPIEEYETKRNFIRFINKNLGMLSSKNNLNRKPKTGDARHSMATNLKNAGVPTHFITELLGHANVQTTENYFDGFEDEQKKEFAKILDNFKKDHAEQPSTT
jgi:integrase